MNKIKVSYEYVVDILLDDKSVGLFQGRSEGGCRSLGNRSILFNPQNKNGKNLINKVKKREFFRPFAATILQEEFDNWFYDISVDYSYMSFCVKCKENKLEKIPCVLHVDNTCRIQTINEKQNLHYYNLIKNFNLKSNVPLLLNTSFNLSGYPIVETVEDALKTLNQSCLDYVYFPEINTLIGK